MGHGGRLRPLLLIGPKHGTIESSRRVSTRLAVRPISVSRDQDPDLSSFKNRDTNEINFIGRKQEQANWSSTPFGTIGKNKDKNHGVVVQLFPLHWQQRNQWLGSIGLSPWETCPCATATGILSIKGNPGRGGLTQTNKSQEKPGRFKQDKYKALVKRIFSRYEYAGERPGEQVKNQEILDKGKLFLASLPELTCQ